MDAGRIPGPRGRRLVGSLPEYDRDRLGWLSRSRDEYGDLVRLAPHALVVHDAEAAHQVLAGTNRGLVLDNAVRVDQLHQVQDRLPDWMRRRRSVTRAIGRHLGPDQIGRMVGLLTEELDRYAGVEGDLVGLCRSVCGRANVRFTVGGGEDPASAELIAASVKAFDDWLTVVEAGEVRVRWLPRPAARRSSGSARRLRALLAAHLARRPRAAVPRDLLDEAAAEIEDDDDLIGVAFTLLFSTQGLPGVTMSWLLVELARHPELAAGLRAELAGRSVSDAVTGELPLAAAFVHEVLRLHPPQWLVSRVTAQPTTLAGYTVPAGQQVLVCPYLLQRDKRWWHDPDTFDPSRWLRDERPRRAFVPFGAGPRYCPGSSLAMIQMLALTALFVSSYAVVLESGSPDRAEHRGLLTPAGLSGSWHTV